MPNAPPPSPPSREGATRPRPPDRRTGPAARPAPRPRGARRGGGPRLRRVAPSRRANPGDRRRPAGGRRPPPGHLVQQGVCRFGCRVSARCTSRTIMLAVPSQIEFSGASRYSRGSGISSMYPLPPMHSMASSASAGARLQFQYLATGQRQPPARGLPLGPGRCLAGRPGQPEGDERRRPTRRPGRPAPGPGAADRQAGRRTRTGGRRGGRPDGAGPLSRRPTPTTQSSRVCRRGRGSVRTPWPSSPTSQITRRLRTRSPPTRRTGCRACP